MLGAVGIANMWLAIFADVGVMIIAVLNAIRALFVKRLLKMNIERAEKEEAPPAPPLSVITEADLGS